MKFKAAILTELNKPLTLAEVETTELQVGQVLVKIILSGLCGAQLQEIAGLKGNANFLPHLLGHEGCGIVQEVGAGVTKVKVGDKVVVHWLKGAGIESPFPTYLYNGKKMSSGKATTISEFSIVSENRLTVVPLDTSPELCALLGCGLTTALGSVNNEAEVKFGESVLVIGSGGVGLNLIMASKMASAYPIIAVDSNSDKMTQIMSVGATAYYNNLELVKSKFDVIFDTTGNPKVISQAVHLLSAAGRLILIGQTKPNNDLVINNANVLFSGNGKTIKTTQGGKVIPQDDIPRYVGLYKAGIINIDKIISHTFGLSQVNEAFDLLRTGKAGRIMINTHEKTME
jgi:S-(hydroxymethyl)glutathione dehydrogenase/alcohol dehydrogenase